MLLLSLTAFLIHLKRRTSKEERKLCAPCPSKSTSLNSSDVQFRQICSYFAGHLDEPMSLHRICRDNLIGRSQLLSLFRRKTGYGAIRFFNQMKIDHAKTLIRQSDAQFSQIARTLGYSSVGYFSRQFRKFTGMSPSEYAESIQALSEQKESL